jgi:hypothetical protein
MIRSLVRSVDMEPKKKTKAKNTKSTEIDGDSGTSFSEINSKEELKGFLESVREKLRDTTAASIYALSAMNFVMNLTEIYTFLDNENKEIARDIWLRIKQSGMQVKTPPMLFKADEDGAAAVAL